MNIALFAPIEGDLQDINTTKVGYKRYFEQEAIKAFVCWRENGGWLKDIPIYAVCPTGKGISDETKARFAELNVTYIEEYMSETAAFDCGFWNIPLVGMWAEQNLTEDVLIKIDLDMNLIRPLPPSMFEGLERTVVGRHGPIPFSPYIEQMGKIHPEFADIYNTGFTISTRHSLFFALQMNALNRCTNAYHDGTFEQKFGLVISRGDDDTQHDAFPYMLLEELCVSIMIKEGVPVRPLDMFYLETDWDEIEATEKAGTPYNTDEIYFIHEHLESTINPSFLQNKIRYKKALKDVPGYDFYLKLFSSTNHRN